MFFFHEIKSRLEILTRCYTTLAVKRRTYNKAAIIKAEKEFCIASGWFVFYGIHVQFKDGIFIVVNPEIAEKIIPDEIPTWHEQLTVLEEKKLNGDITELEERKIVQLTTALEESGYSAKLLIDQDGKRTMAIEIDRIPFNSGNGAV